MKLILVEYLASLKERGELDVIVPDLLSEIGLTVLSRPSIGTKQYGVDVAAVGKDTDGTRRLFLLSIKSGDLRRSDWDSGPQALRPSLNQIIDVYIRNNVPAEYASLPVRIVICLGGDLHEDVRADVVAFIDNNTKNRITFELWNGDRLADLLLSGVLRENALPDTWRSDYRKSVALVDEPVVSFGHFCRLLKGIAVACEPKRSARLTAVRQIYLGLWTLYVWARNADNIEAAYLSSERALLIGWLLIKDYLNGKSKLAEQLRDSMERLISLHNGIADDYLNSYLHPRAHLAQGLTSSVPSHSSLDINLRLFDIVGRVGARGLWLLRAHQCLDPNERADDRKLIRAKIDRTAELLANILQNNPILCTPVKNNHAIDINIACLFLNRVGCDHIVQPWVQQIARATRFAYLTNGPYPCVFDDYRELTEHPKTDPSYRTEATAGSLLLPTLAVWSAITDDAETLGALADFASGPYSHSTLQLWFPSSNSEEHLYANSDQHGLAFTDIKIEDDPQDMLAPVNSECTASASFESLSALKYGLWPLIILSSRHYRSPVPPHFWPFTHWALDNL